MNPPVFSLLKNDSATVALLGDATGLRVYPWGSAPAKVVRPYVTYGVFHGQPENFINSNPDIDNMGTQVDIWADTTVQVEAIYIAVRNALQVAGHMLAYSGTIKDPETNLYNGRLEFDFWVNR